MPNGWELLKAENVRLLAEVERLRVEASKMAEDLSLCNAGVERAEKAEGRLAEMVRILSRHPQITTRQTRDYGDEIVSTALAAARPEDRNEAERMRQMLQREREGRELEDSAARLAAAQPEEPLPHPGPYLDGAEPPKDPYPDDEADMLRDVNRELLLRAERIALLEARLAKVVEAASALMEEMAEIQETPEYKAVWTLAHIHGQPYTGRNWKAKYDSLCAALAAARPEEHREQIATAPCKDAVWGSRGEWYCSKHGTADPDSGCPEEKSAAQPEEESR